MVKEIKLEGDIQLVLNRKWGQSNPYSLKLCCKKVATLENPCPGEHVALKIDKCIAALDQVFCVEEMPTLNKQVINVQTGYEQNLIRELPGSWLLYVPTDNVEHGNKVCIKDLIIPVQPDCLDLASIGQCVDAKSMIKPVFIAPLSGRELCECYVIVYDDATGVPQGTSTCDSTDPHIGSVLNSTVLPALENCNLSDELDQFLRDNTSDVLINTLSDIFEGMDDALKFEFESVMDCYKIANGL